MSLWNVYFDNFIGKRFARKIWRRSPCCQFDVGTKVIRSAYIVRHLGIYRSQDFFRGGDTFSKKFSKNFVKHFVKIFKKFSKNFLRKLLKIDFLSIFSKNLTNRACNFCAFGRKTQIVGKFWDNFRKFWKNSLENCKNALF